MKNSRDKKRKFLSKYEILAGILTSAVFIFYSFALSENDAEKENAGTDWVFFFSFAALAVFCVVVINVVIIFILPIVRQNIKERKLAKEDQ